jgi:hypothetical protein
MVVHKSAGDWAEKSQPLKKIRRHRHGTVLRTELLVYDTEAQRWAVDLSEGGRKSVRAPNLALLSRDDCPEPPAHAVVMLSRGKIRESGGGEAAEAALCKMALVDPARCAEQHREPMLEFLLTSPYLRAHSIENTFYCKIILLVRIPEPERHCHVYIL